MLEEFGIVHVSISDFFGGVVPYKNYPPQSGVIAVAGFFEKLIEELPYFPASLGHSALVEIGFYFVDPLLQSAQRLAEKFIIGHLGPPFVPLLLYHAFYNKKTAAQGARRSKCSGDYYRPYAASECPLLSLVAWTRFWYSARNATVWSSCPSAACVGAEVTGSKRTTRDVGSLSIFGLPRKRVVPDKRIHLPGIKAIHGT
jgi:hypothetical protein